MRENDEKQLKILILITISLTMISMMVISILEQLRVVYNFYVEYGSVIFVLGAVVLSVFSIMLKKTERKLYAIDILVLLAIVSVVISSIIASDKEVVISGASLHAEGIGVCIGYIIFLYSASFISDEKYRKVLYYVATLIAIVNVVLGYIQAVLHPSFFEQMYETMYFSEFRAFGTMENPNPYGSLMALFLGIESILFYKSKIIKQYIWHGMLLVLYSYGLVLSGTRGAIVGYGGAAFVFSIILLKRAYDEKEIKSGIIRLVIVVVAISISAMCVKITSSDTVVDVVERVSYDSSTMQVESVGTARIKVWQKSLAAVGNKFVFGVGISNLKVNIDEPYLKIITADAHNRYLQIFCTQGIFGLIIYLVLVAYILYKIRPSHTYDLAILMGVTAYLIADCFCIGMYSLAPYLYIGLGLLIYREKKKIIS